LSSSSTKKKIRSDELLSTVNYDEDTEDSWHYIDDEDIWEKVEETEPGYDFL